ncbi:alpha/beta fold hydrolase [Jiangella alkaliphila]|uniref:Pimeloyl-ACP methyl ester carboxylesterase n=1 Tax=Jiangella alkaliphila TaxID=419479 RepID=A0A1H2LYA5_9ACTN|nr:alpha/beta fold hydrolase [Jiangella alkaliphila]SDU85276.1 Pimeloyl-ACP methyl ester carboxylesterase [Jiangella alkaliphila]
MSATLFDVGDYRLAAEITGDGPSTVVFSSGLGDAGEAWAATIAALSTRARVLTYARAGVSESDALPAPAPRSYGDAADELRRLLATVGLKEPVVLVGHSIGAIIALVFTATWPDTVAGLVLVDPSDVQLPLDLEPPKLVMHDGDREDRASFDMRRGAAEAVASRQHLGIPNVVITSRVGRWLEVATPEFWQPFSLEDLDERWQRHHRELATSLGGSRPASIQDRWCWGATDPG